ncbi:class I SAM-dependent methyltransferase, partial [Candidatus Woesearchaeota archaeon]|nr:class I SAM-dependent methyltransferase [Candidatus Woesearchaeota archaeon]
MKNDPTFAELWDECLRNLMYHSISDYIDHIELLFRITGATKSSHILDTCAGTGFPALHLRARGYSVDCMDASDDMIALFLKKAAKEHLPAAITKMRWEQLPGHFEAETYDLLLCRGNSFVYAAGGWMSEQAQTREASMSAYIDTLKKFRSMLKKEGFLYIDKWKDSEVEGRHVIGPEIHFEVTRPEPHTRKARLIAEDSGRKTVFPASAYALSEAELEELILDAGFRSCDKIDIPSEH